MRFCSTIILNYLEKGLIVLLLAAGVQSAELAHSDMLLMQLTAWVQVILSFCSIYTAPSEMESYTVFSK